MQYDNLIEFIKFEYNLNSTLSPLTVMEKNRAVFFAFNPALLQYTKPQNYSKCHL